MRLSSVFALAGVFVAAAAVSLIGARFAVTAIEDNSRTGVLNALDDGGLTWGEVQTDGLRVYLAGTAPTEAARFRALSVAGGVVEASRLIDQMLVEEEQEIAAPRFSMEILRNDSGVSLIGLVPASMDRDGFVARIKGLQPSGRVADFLESADYPAPPGWDAAVTYALRPLEALERTKISVDADRVAVTAVTNSAEDKADVEQALSRRVPTGLDLALEISAPRPVLTPFTLRFVIEDGRARFDACSADTEDARTRIVKAATLVGLSEDDNCVVGLGAPSPKWAEAVEQSIMALFNLGGGVLTVSDADVSILALQGTSQPHFDDVIGSLDSDLPDLFALTAVLPEPEVEETEEEGPEFVATLSPEGLVQLRGRVSSDGDRYMVDSFAMARFTTDSVHMTARVDEAVPDDWTYRIMTGLDALAFLTKGVVNVTPDSLSVRGATHQEDASVKIASLFSEKLGDAAQVSIDLEYQELAQPEDTTPTPEECEARIAAKLAENKITFEPGSARIDVAGARIMDDIAEILRECGALAMEIGGHTDSQGREVMNQQLSQSRAQAVLSELRARRVLTGAITAVGYGESAPIADNGTEEGREENRRIEFKMIYDKDTAEAVVEETATVDEGDADATPTEDKPAQTDTDTDQAAQTEDSDGQN